MQVGMGSCGQKGSDFGVEDRLGFSEVGSIESGVEQDSRQFLRHGALSHPFGAGEDPCVVHPITLQGGSEGGEWSLVSVDDSH